LEQKYSKVTSGKIISQYFTQLITVHLSLKSMTKERSIHNDYCQSSSISIGKSNQYSQGTVDLSNCLDTFSNEKHSATHSLKCFVTAQHPWA
jgi:hypothetical protein